MAGHTPGHSDLAGQRCHLAITVVLTGALATLNPTSLHLFSGPEINVTDTSAISESLLQPYLQWPEASGEGR